jgi:hypothetical protein
MFLDFLIGASPGARQEVYRLGLDELNAVTRKKYGKNFAEVNAAQADAIVRPLIVAWGFDLPEDPLLRFMCEVHCDLRKATFNSREWAESASLSGRRRAGNTGTYFPPIE